MKKLMFSIAAMAIMGAASYMALRSKNSEREFTALELANIEALAVGEGTPVKRCFIYSISSGEDEGWHNDFCDDRTTPDMIYPCVSDMKHGYHGIRTNCTK